MPTTPIAPPHPASAPTSRLRKRGSAGRPLTSSGNLRGGVRTLDSTPEIKLHEGPEDRRVGQTTMRASENGTSHGPSMFEFKGAENTPPSWLRRVSTLSSLKSGSPDRSPRPGSPSISYSNGSSAPILPSSTGPSPAIASRNKLVKRSSSQRALHGSNTLHSTLRRPATSHQRSATLQRQYLQDDDDSRPSPTPAILPRHLPDGRQSHDESQQIWRPFFKSQASASGREGLRRRSSNSLMTRNETSKTIVPSIKELPTLLLATSISSGSSIETTHSRASNTSGVSRPFTPIPLESLPPPTSNSTDFDAGPDSEPSARYSLSIGDIFPSPSPSSWRVPRSSSLRRNKALSRNVTGSRVVSAPHATDSQTSTEFVHGSGIDDRQPTPRHRLERQNHDGSVLSGHTKGPWRSLSSPLPPIAHVSSFEVDLPDEIVSYPMHSPEIPLSPPNPSPHSSSLFSSPLGPSLMKTRPHRFSSAPSDRGSTLLGSDNDNSRLLSGDEDDLDARSETIYDSTRTGATGSSHSGARKPPIDTIFDESPPPTLPPRYKLVELQQLLQADSFAEQAQGIKHSLETERDVSTPIRSATKCKEDGGPTPMHETSEIFLSTDPSVSSHSVPPESKRSNQVASMNDAEDDLWSFENTSKSSPYGDGTGLGGGSLGRESNTPRATKLQNKGNTPNRRHSPSSSGFDHSLKSNIFEWSEQQAADKDSFQGDSPRPKTVHGRQGKDIRGSRANGRRGPSALHLRSQSVPVQKDMAGHRGPSNASKLDAWILGPKGPSEDWDGDFEFDEPSRTPKQSLNGSEQDSPSRSSGMLVPEAILGIQASVHRQFGQVKELRLLVEELKRLQQKASTQGIMEGQSAELWKEAEGIINLVTQDDEDQELFPPRSPSSPNFDFENLDEDSPSNRSRRRTTPSSPKDNRLSMVTDSASQLSARPSQDLSSPGTPSRVTRPRNESSAKAKSVLETIQRSQTDPSLLEVPLGEKKLPFDTTSLKDLVTRAGVVTRALKEIVRRAENGPATPDPQPSTPRDPPFISQMFQQPSHPITPKKSPRVTPSPKSPRSQRSSPFLGGSIAGNDNEINGHMNIMTVV